jgi:hypothetical protein
MKLKAPLEKEITKDIRRFLTIRNIFNWKVWQGLGSIKGVPDIIACYKGRMIAIEVKGQKGKLSPHQELFMDNLKQAGAICFVARSVDDVIKNLKEYL